MVRILIAVLHSFIKVEKLCNRVSSATLLADRRDALRALKSLSKVYSVFTVLSCCLVKSKIIYVNISVTAVYRLTG